MSMSNFKTLDYEQCLRFKTSYRDLFDLQSYTSLYYKAYRLKLLTDCVFKECRFPPEYYYPLDRDGDFLILDIPLLKELGEDIFEAIYEENKDTKPLSLYMTLIAPTIAEFLLYKHLILVENQDALNEAIYGLRIRIYHQVISRGVTFKGLNNVIYVTNLAYFLGLSEKFEFGYFCSPKYLALVKKAYLNLKNK